jgi:uncharacterized protein YkwD
VLLMLWTASANAFAWVPNGETPHPSGGTPQSRDVYGDRGKNGPERSGGRASRATVAEDDDAVPRQRFLREIETLEQQCLNEVNRIRSHHGLKPFDLDLDLLDVARGYSKRMAEERFFSHLDPEGRSVKQRIEQASIRWRMVGENLAYANGYVNPVAASMHGWMESPGHRSNILDPDFRLTAVGVWISSNGTVYFTEIFLKQ